MERRPFALVRPPLLLLFLAAACAPVPPAASDAPDGAPAAAVAAHPHELVVSARSATLVLDPATGRTRRTLPAGILSPAKDLLLSVLPDATTCGDPRAPGPCTLAAAYDLGGKQIAEWWLPGRFELPASYGPAPSAFSPNGDWAVLVRRDEALTTFAILDVLRGGWQPIDLGARFSFDAIHNDGGALYLIEHPVAGSTAYNVRLYDVRARHLVVQPIFDKAQLAAFDPTRGLMDGAFHASVAPVGGVWSYGLYVRRDGRPFVHALNVAQRFATCIVDLPGRRDPASMLSLALAPDARLLFVTDTGTGTVGVIDAATQKVARTGAFAGRGGTGDGARAQAAVSRDGSRLYATAARGVAVVSTGDLRLRSWAAPELEVSALALSPEGSRLYALSRDAVHVLETPSGRPLTALPVPPDARAIAVIPAR